MTLQTSCTTNHIWPILSLAMTQQTLSQPDRERLQPLVLADTATRIRIASAITGKSHGEVIDELVAQNLPPVPVESEAAERGGQNG